MNLHGEKRSAETHQSTSDSEAKSARKGDNQPPTRSDLAKALREDRNGLVVDLRFGPATGYGERSGALAMLDKHLADRPGIRDRVEENVAWTKTVGCSQRNRFKGQARGRLAAHLVGASNLFRMANLTAAPT